MFWIIFFSSIPILIILFYHYLKWKYFRLYGLVPGLEPEFLFGNLRQLGIISSNKQIIDSYIHGCQKLQKQFGDIFQFWMGTNHCYVFCRPDHAEQIYSNRQLFDRAEIRRKTFGLVAENALVTLIGLKYKRHAKAVLPMLKKNKFLSQTSIMTNYVDQLIQIWKEKYENKECTSIVHDNQQLLLDVFTLLAFDYNSGRLSDIEKRTSDLNTALSIWLDALKRVGTNGMPSFINYYLLKFDRKYQNALKILESYAEKIIQKCQEEIYSDDKPMNLVASLVSSLQKDEEIEKQKDEKDKIGITKNELLDEIIGLIVAGFETTATVISWFIYYVSKNPEIQEKIKTELKQNGITKQTSLNDFNQINQCEYIDCVIKETLRIGPIIVGSFRTLTDDTIIDGIQLSKGETVLTAFSLMQTDRRYWNLDPNLFIPERFYGNNAVDVNHHPFAFSPFGGGHRMCPGQDLARLELKIIIIRLMQFVTFIDAPGNNGGHYQRLSIMPKELAVYIKFD